MEVHILPDYEAMSKRAADIFIHLSKRYIASKKSFVVALSGASTPKRLYALLGSDQYKDKADWKCIHFFWVDERYVPYSHSDSNYRLLHDTLFSKIPVPLENIHPVSIEISLQVSSKRYEEEIKSFFGITKDTLPVFDLISLGIGKDGHTASLFPKSKSLKEKGHIAVPVIRKKPDHHRVTLTLPVINNAENILFLVSGKNKAEVVKKVLEKKDPSFPASLVEPKKGILFFLMDKEAGLYINFFRNKKFQTR